MVKQGAKWIATTNQDVDKSVLQGNSSDVQLQVLRGYPRGLHLMSVRTDLSSFGSVVPDDECFIAPVVEIYGPVQRENSSYVVQIPHCLSGEEDFSQLLFGFQNDWRTLNSHWQLSLHLFF